MSTDNLGLTADAPRPVHVLPIGAEKDGEIYEGCPCKVCGYFIGIDQRRPEAARIPDAQYVVATCPQCKTYHTSTWGGRERRRYETRAAKPNLE